MLQCCHAREWLLGLEADQPFIKLGLLGAATGRSGHYLGLLATLRGTC